MTCHIIGAGDFAPHLLSTGEGDLIIAADGGLSPLQEAGIRPDLFIGDCDSLKARPEGIETILLPAEKDDTDLLAAARVGLARGYRRFAFYGALGGKRFSHSLANLQILSFLAEHESTGELIDHRCRVSLLSAGKHSLPFSGGYFSLFAFDQGAVVTVTGAKYPLSHAALSPSMPLGVSNEGGEGTRILVEQGRLILVCEP